MASILIMTDFFKKKHIQAAAWIVALFLATLPIFTRSYSEFEFVFLHYASVLVQGGNLYHDGSIFLYPPWMAFVCIPLTWLPNLAARICWGILNMFFLWLAIRSAWNLSRIAKPANSQETLWVPAIGAICSATFFLNCISHQQFDVVIAGLVLGGLWQLSQGKSGLGGLLLGLGAACKITPLLFLPYLIYRARWKAAAIMMAAFFFCNLIPEAFLGLTKENIPRLGIYSRQTLAPLLDPDFVPGTWGSEIIYNQSLSGLSKRWNQTTLVRVNQKIEVKPVDPRWNPGAGKLVLYAFLVASAAFTFFCWGRPGWSSTSLQQAKIPLESSMVFCGMLLLSPMSSPAHFGILILPALILGWVATGSNRAFPWIFLATAIVAGVGLNKDLVGTNTYTALLWYGIPTWATYSLFLGNGWSLRQQPLSNYDQYSSK